MKKVKNFILFLLFLLFTFSQVKAMGAPKAQDIPVYKKGPHMGTRTIEPRVIVSLDDSNLAVTISKYDGEVKVIVIDDAGCVAANRCNGRTLLLNQKEGELSLDGDVVWDKTKQSERLGLATFENSNCLNCKMLPRCMGPCSQKLAEHKGFSKAICTMETMDITLKEYLLLEFEKRMSICGYENFK